MARKRSGDCSVEQVGGLKLIRSLNTQVDDVFTLLSQRAATRDAGTEAVVERIIKDVRTRGDAALLESAQTYDAPHLTSIRVSQDEIEAASALDFPAIELAATRIRDFHAQQLAALTAGWNKDAGYQWGAPKSSPGGAFGPGFLGQRMLPVSVAGVYVPGGRATYPSSVLMNAIPAMVAGVPLRIVTTPARPDGTLAPAVLKALRQVGVTHAFKVGGAAAIAALALGTESVPRVDKVVGPGNRFVNEAKRQLWGQVGVDGYAGPSEVCVLADDKANASYAAADLLTQIEHAPDNVGFLVTVSAQKQSEILAEVERQLAGAPREDIMRMALKKESMAIVARDLQEACEVVNAIAPEHLSLAVEQYEIAMSRIQNAGCILIGEFSPESAGDFAAGPSHTLPTSGAARWQNPVNVLDFLKIQSVIHLTRPQLAEIAPIIAEFGNLEGFPAHAHGTQIRFKG